MEFLGVGAVCVLDAARGEGLSEVVDFGVGRWLGCGCADGDADWVGCWGCGWTGLLLLLLLGRCLAW